MAQLVRAGRGRSLRDGLPGIVDQAYVLSTSTQIRSSVQHEVGLLEIAPRSHDERPTEEAPPSLQSNAPRQAAVSRWGSFQFGRGKWQV